MTDGSPIKTFITGACAGLAEVRQALQGHPEIEIVGTAVEPGKADQKLASSGAQVILHGTAPRRPAAQRRDRRDPSRDGRADHPRHLRRRGRAAARGARGRHLRRRDAAAAHRRAGVHDQEDLPAGRHARRHGAVVAAHLDRRGPRPDRVLAQGRRRQDRARHLAGDADRPPRRPPRAAGRPRPAVRRRRDHDGRRAREDDLRPRHDDRRARPREARGLRHHRTPRASTSCPRRCGPRTPSSWPRTASRACSTSPRRPTT